MWRSKQLASLLLLAITALPVIAQTDSARLEGTVQDQSGAVVPNAKVVALDTKTQKSSRTTTDGQGHFVLPPLQPGIYRVTVDAPGFRKAESESDALPEERRLRAERTQLADSTGWWLAYTQLCWEPKWKSPYI
jgi:hypothetical protein